MSQQVPETGPNLEDISYSGELLSRSNYEVMLLDDEAFRALLNLVCFSANARCWTYSAPDPDGKLPADDTYLARLAGVSPLRWKRSVRDKVAIFFRVTAAHWFLDRDWIRIGGAQNIRPPIPAGMRSFVMQRDNFTCGYCGSKEAPFHCDHVVPVSKGGATHPDNLICACSPCNLDKKAKDADEWIAERSCKIINFKARSQA